MELAKFIRKWRESGLAYTLLHGFTSFVPGKFVALDSFVVTAKELVPSEIPHSVESCRWVSTVDDAEALRRAGYSLDQLQGRFDKGAFAAVVEQDGRVVASSWYVPGAGWDEYWIRFETTQGDVWRWDSWVEPGLRGQGLFGRLQTFAEWDLEAQRFSRIVNTVSTLNRNSIRAVTKAGYVPLLYVSFFRLMGWTLLKAEGRLRFGRYTGRVPFELKLPAPR